MTLLLMDVSNSFILSFIFRSLSLSHFNKYFFWVILLFDLGPVDLSTSFLLFTLHMIHVHAFVHSLIPTSILFYSALWCVLLFCHCSSIYQFLSFHSFLTDVLNSFILLLLFLSSLLLPCLLFFGSFFVSNHPSISNSDHAEKRRNEKINST